MSQDIPDRIYLQLWQEDGELSHWLRPTWCEDRAHDTDILYTQSDRLRLLEAVAKAARAILDTAYAAEYSGERLWKAMAVGAEALAALDEKEQP